MGDEHRHKGIDYRVYPIRGDRGRKLGYEAFFAMPGWNPEKRYSVGWMGLCVRGEKYVDVIRQAKRIVDLVLADNATRQAEQEAK